MHLIMAFVMSKSMLICVFSAFSLFSGDSVSAQFTGILFYKSLTKKSTDADSVWGRIEIRYSPNRVLVQTSEHSGQFLYSFDEKLARFLDTGRNLKRVDTIGFRENVGTPILIDTALVGDDWIFHFRLTHQDNLMGQSLNVTSDFWVTKSLRLHCGGLKKYYNPYANGSGFALVRLRRITVIEGFYTTTTELYLEKVEPIPYQDNDLQLIGSPGG